MKVILTTNIAFKRQLKSNEIDDFRSTLELAKKKSGNIGKTTLIIPSSSLPQSQASNTGMGNLLSKDGENFVNFAKLYWGINNIQLLPNNKPKEFRNGIYKPYSASSFELAEDLINPESLESEEFGNLLSSRDVEEIVRANKKKNIVNFENVLSSNSETNLKLKTAFENFLKQDTPKKQEVLKRFNLYREQNKNWLEAKGVFYSLKNKLGDVSNWSDIDRNLYNDDIVSKDVREERIKQIYQLNKKEIEFFEFKQYLADEHLKKAKNNLNEKGIKLSGDFIYSFSFDEKWANPKAFHKGYHGGYGLPALNFETKEGIELLKNKIDKYANRYDGIRVDMAWAYSNQPLYKSYTDDISRRLNYDDKILNIIENEFKNVKGKIFSKEDIIYEFVCSPDMFSIYDGQKLKPYLKDKVKQYTSSNMEKDWGTVDGFISRGWSGDDFILGISTPDSIPTKISYANPETRENETKILSEILKIPQKKLSSLQDFLKAKFAEPMRGKNVMFYFQDVLSLNGKYKGNELEREDYRLRIPETYQKDYFDKLTKGEGLNIMDSLDKAFVSKGLNESEPELYKKIVKYKKILQSPENKNHSLIFWGIGLLLSCLGAGVLYLRNGKIKNQKSS
jgi:hypothetical protein